MNLSMFLGALGSLFAIMNPLVSLPMFLSLTASYSPARQKRSALKVGMYTTIFCAVVLATGSLLLKVFGISVDGFRVAGGLVLAIIGIGMLHGESTVHDGTASEQAHQTEHATSGDISFYPMTFPMLAGPGTITTLVLLAGHADGLADWVAVGAALLVILVALTVVLFCAGFIGKHLSQTLRTIVTRLMGMILTAIGVSMIAAGVKALLPGLAG